MSRKVIQRMVMPIIQPQLQAMKIIAQEKVQERLVENYFERELIQAFGIIGSVDHCDRLEESIKEVQRIAPGLFERYLLQLLQTYLGKGVQKHGQLVAEEESAVRLS